MRKVYQFPNPQLSIASRSFISSFADQLEPGNIIKSSLCKIKKTKRLMRCLPPNLARFHSERGN